MPSQVFRLLTFVIIVILATDVSAAPPETQEHEFVKGISWGWVGSRGDYESPEAAESMKKLAATGAEWVCIAFATTMQSPHNPDFTWGDDKTSMVTDDEIRQAVKLARDNGLKVILKPVVNCDDGTWRAWIRFYRPVTEEEKAAGTTGEMDPWGDVPVMREGEVKDLAAWDRWWGNYQNFLIHYAELAQETDAEIFCLGCEMSSTEEFVDKWRSLIGEIRPIYTGQLVYDINHGHENQLAWWDAVDIIGVSGYYQVPPPEGVTIEEAVKQTTSEAEIAVELAKVKQQLAEVSRKWHKPVMMIETGVTNVRGCARYPWSHPDAELGHPLDEAEQANYYRAFFKTFSEDAPWFMGYAWWDWPARLYHPSQAAQNRGFCIHGKQAEEVVKEWYAKPSPAVVVE
ncbi:MAG: hypothetical protein SH868_14220 [Bythopirellula sp.]|nr:hypothetical protein [Bythopirellula sp.]